MTSFATQPSRITRKDLLGGLRVQISGAVPEEEHWTQPHLNEKILAFVQRLSELVVLYGGRIVHGNNPGLTPAIVGCVQMTVRSGPGGVGVRLKHTPAITLVASALWPLSWEFPLSPDLFSVIQTPVVGDGDAKDAKTRNASLTALRLAISQEVDVVVAVGGKLHGRTGFNPGVLEELCLARWRNIPCFVIACFGGFAGELDTEIIRQFSAGNGLDAGDGASREQDSEMRRMASWDEDIPSMAGDLIAHLVAHRDEFQERAHARADWPRIPLREDSHPREGHAIRKAEVSIALIDQAAARFDAVLKEMKAPTPDHRKIGQLLEQDLTFTGRIIQDRVGELARGQERSIRRLVDKVERDLTESLPLSDADRIRIYRDTGEALKQYLVERLREAKVAPHGTAADRGEPARIFLDLSTLQIGSSTTPGEPLRGTTLPGGFDLRLMYSESDVSSIPTSGTNLVIVADVKGVLYFRIFGADGKVVVDTDETRLTTQAGPIADLKRRLDSVRPPHELTRSEKDRVVTAVTSIVDHTLPGHYLEGHRLSRWVENLDKMHPVSDDLYDVVLLRILTAREVPEIREIYNKTGRTGKDPGTLLKDAFALLATLDSPKGLGDAVVRAAPRGGMGVSE